jgi:hypothetical protein
VLELSRAGARKHQPDVRRPVLPADIVGDQSSGPETSAPRSKTSFHRLTQWSTGLHTNSGTAYW